MTFDIYDRWYFGGPMVMIGGIFFLLLGVFGPTNESGESLGEIFIIISFFFLIFGAFLFYIGKRGIDIRDAKERKIQSEREELLVLRERVKELEGNS